jgi:hypothetical protein
MKGRVVVAMVGAVAAALSACRRPLEGARCPCAAGWTCCETIDTCVPAAEAPLACPGGSTGAGGETGDARDADTDDGDANGGDARDADISDGPSFGGPALDALPDATSGDGSADGPDSGGSSDGPAPVPPPDVPQVCTSEGWCWTHPLPTNDRFVQVLGVDEDDTWLVGASGTIVRHAAGRWSTIPSPTDALSSIWASGRNDVWVGGPAGPFHWNGSSWSQTALVTEPLKRAVRALWGCARNDVWAVGGAVTHWDGERWSYVDLPTDQPWQALWGAGCDAVWAGQLDPRTGAGATWRWDGAWKKLSDRPAERIAGTGPEDVWSFAQGALSHWVGREAATPVAMMAGSARALGLFSIATDGVGVMEIGRAVSLRAPGGATSLPKAVPNAVATLWGKTANDIWGVGAGGTAWRWDGQTWTQVLPAWSLASDAATRIIATSATELWAVVGGVLLQRNDRSWETVLSAAETGGGINDVWASSADDVWVATADGHLLRSSPTGWYRQDPWPGAGLDDVIRRVSGTGPKDVWVVRGDSSLLHFNGEVWVGRDPDDDRITDVWAAAPGEAWIVGQKIAHWQGGGWQTPPRIPAAAASATFSAVAGSGPADVWFLAGGSLLQLSADGRDLTVLINSDWQAVALAPSPAGDVWAMFRDGAVASRLYRSSDPYSVVLAPASLNDVAATGDGALWVAGPGGALLRKAPDGPAF